MGFKKKLDDLVKESVLMSQTHPYLDLTIYNYTKETQYKGEWDAIILMCRGLVLNSEGEIVARPFSKFFNDSELNKEEIPKGLPFDVYEKMDGFLLILFQYKGEWVLASRGSFDSDFQKEGYKIIQPLLERVTLDPKYTYLFECITPAFTIVVNYEGRKDVVLLGAIETETGKELEYSDLEKIGFSLPKKYDYTDYTNIKKLDWNNAEGFVIKFSNGFRMKIKFETYTKIHGALIRLSNIKIWKLLKDGYKNLIAGFPDESWPWCNKVCSELEAIYQNKKSEYFDKFNMLYSEGMSKKDFAEKAWKDPDFYILFAIFDKHEDKLSEFIWKKIKPQREEFRYLNDEE
jgi:RNA ligase